MSPLARMRCFAALLAVAVLAAGCARPAPPSPVVRRWFAGHVLPAFDPDGPPDALRWALERALSRGLVELDSAGALRPGAARVWAWSADSLALTFTLRDSLRFTDGTAVTSADFAAALRGGLARNDHATREWLLASLVGIERVRAGRPLPALGIETPDPGTLVLRLAHRDPRLLEKLALPGVATPWRARTGTWADAVGIGPWRMVRAEGDRALLLVRADAHAPVRAAADTLHVHFASGAPRARTVLRANGADLVWPLPPTLLDQPVPAGYATESRAAVPERRLVLLMRADMPPTTKLPARHALAHATSRSDLIEALGRAGEPELGWLPGAGPFEFPRFDVAEMRSWLERGKLGASFHVVLAWDADGAGASVARALQGCWARAGLYAELRPLRGAAAAAEPLKPAAAHVQLLETQALLPGAEAELASYVMPLRGPAVGAFRSGWRTREFDPWLARTDGAVPFDPAAAQLRLVEERLALPVARLPWLWVARQGGAGVAFHPRFGPEWASSRD
ncbi:MAG: ABC transporter substrate-binding protein [Candidatus Eisenbacteria bacterium]